LYKLQPFDQLRDIGARKSDTLSMKATIATVVMETVKLVFQQL